MNSKSCKGVVVAIAWAVFPSIALAAQSSQVESQKVRPPADPNQKICQDITVVGSRLATKRICATRAEWEAQKRADKNLVDDIQRSPCVRDESGNCGGH